jgi:hypothetical protein
VTPFPVMQLPVTPFPVMQLPVISGDVTDPYLLLTCFSTNATWMVHLHYYKPTSLAKISNNIYYFWISLSLKITQIKIPRNVVDDFGT